MRVSLIIIAFMAALGCHAQTESPLGYGEVALGRKADGSNLMMHVVPTNGKATYFKISEKMPYVLIGNEKGVKMYNTESGEYITNVKLGSKNLAQLCPDGYLTYSEGGLFFFSFGSPTFYNLDGKKVWSNKQMLIMANGKSNVLVCDKHSKRFFFTGYEMNTGRELWQRSISGTKCYPFLPSHCYNVPGQEGSITL